MTAVHHGAAIAATLSHLVRGELESREDGVGRA